MREERERPISICLYRRMSVRKFVVVNDLIVLTCCAVEAYELPRATIIAIELDCVANYFSYRVVLRFCPYLDHSCLLRLKEQGAGKVG